MNKYKKEGMKKQGYGNKERTIKGIRREFTSYIGIRILTKGMKPYHSYLIYIENLNKFIAMSILKVLTKHN